MGVDAARCWFCLQAIRRETPLVQNITNFVSMDIVANGLLALGASPAMVHAAEEMADFVPMNSALVINIGTLTPAWVASMKTAAGLMREERKPWVLDPVGVGASAYRTSVARDLSTMGPSVIRANASEIMTLAGAASGGGKGVDSVHGSDQAIEAAERLALETGAVVAVTGEIDYVTDGRQCLRVANGHPLMTRVTALGCTASAIVAAFLTVEQDPLAASAEALAVYGLAAERAALLAEGPGSLRWRLLDELSALDQPALLDGIRIS
jgi:hydroxyethylthiazole kinase